MLKKLLFLLLIGMSVIFSQSWTGDGTEGNAYVIDSAADLALLATNVNAGTNYSGVYFVQTVDIDLSGYANWTPIGDFSTAHPFSGRYGVLGGKKITGLTINNSSVNNLGLFGYTVNANIQDVVLISVNVIGGSFVAALIGSSNSTYVEGCSSSGTVSGVNRVGGLIGNKSGNNIESSNSSCTVTGSGSFVGGFIGANVNSSTITNCYSSGATIAGGQDVGGLVGQNLNSSSITNCYSSNSVTGTNYLGGLAGLNSTNSAINSCYSSASVTGTSNFIGGLVGQNYNSSTITDSYSSTGTVQGAQYVGGFVGQNYQGSTIQNSYSTNNVLGSSTDIGGFVGGNLAEIGSSATIDKCYSTGTVSGLNNLGAFAGTNNPDASISNCYSRGNVTRTSGTEINIGGFVGLKYGTVAYCFSTGAVIYSGGTNPLDKGFIGFYGDGFNTNNFFDTETSSQTSGTGATATSTANMKIANTFLSAGWDGAIWNIGDGRNDGYPYLDWQNTGGTPLPVELTSFSAAYRVESVELKWTTATEVNNYGFNLERRTKNEEWKQISFVQGHGNSNSPKSYSYLDPNPPNGKVQYRLKQIDFDGKYEYSEIVEVNVEAPTQFSLQQNYPNPFNPETSISYKVQAASQVSLKVFDVLGREVTILVNEFKQPGNYNATFNAKTLRATSLPSGIYFYMLKAGNFVSTKKMTLLK